VTPGAEGMKGDCAAEQLAKETRNSGYPHNLPIRPIRKFKETTAEEYLADTDAGGYFRAAVGGGTITGVTEVIKPASLRSGDCGGPKDSPVISNSGGPADQAGPHDQAPGGFCAVICI